VKVAQLHAAQRIVAEYKLPLDRGMLLNQWTNRDYVTLRFMDNEGSFLSFDIYKNGTYAPSEV
jgi:predicted metal-dependent phosphotriesterase family hydrolase